MDILNGLLLTDKEKIKMAETFNANKFQILTKIVIPANIPTLFNTLKVNIGLSLVGVISGEFLVSKGGLGYLIVYGGQVFKLDLVMTSVIILAIVASIMYESIVILEKKIEDSNGREVPVVSLIFKDEENVKKLLFLSDTCSIDVIKNIIKGQYGDLKGDEADLIILNSANDGIERILKDAKLFAR